MSAACAAPGVNPDLFFPGRGDSSRPAKRICKGCPMRARCLAAALALPASEDHGVRGGLNRAERLRLRGVGR